MQAKQKQLEESLNGIYQLFMGEQYKQSLPLCLQTVEQFPDDAQAQFLLGMAYFFTRNFEKAVLHLKRATEILPEGANYHYNLGSSYWELHQYNKAIDAFRKTLEIQPSNAAATNDLGLALAKVGQLEESIVLYKRALELQPTHPFAAGNLIQAECQCAPIAAWPAYCNSLLSRMILTQEHRYTGLIFRAIAEWVTSNMADLDKTLAASFALRPQNETQYTINMLVFDDILRSLIPYRNSHTQLYTTNKKPLYIVGDSHAINYANLGVKLDGEEYQVHSHLIIGIKAWHMISPQPTKYKTAFDYYIHSLPENAELLLSMGELDCHAQYGILPYWQKKGGSLAAIVEEQVTAYVSAMTAQAAALHIRLSFLAVPAPRKETGERREVISLFNKTLEKAAKAAGHRYIDLYSLTVMPNGFANDYWYIDEYHLKPEALTKAVA